MDRRAAEKLVGGLVKVWAGFDGEYVCELSAITKSSLWRAQCVVVGVSRVMNGPEGWRMPFIDGFTFEATGANVQPWVGSRPTWSESAVHAARREVEKGAERGARWDESFREQLNVLLAKLQAGEAGRTPDYTPGMRRGRQPVEAMAGR